MDDSLDSYGPKCPKCGSNNIDTYRMMTGPIWCTDCYHRVENKERDTSFFLRDRNKKK